MRKILMFVVLAVLLISAATAVQNPWITVAASAITDAQGVPIASGTLYFLATDDSDRPLPGFRPGGGGQVIRAPVTCAVTNGSITGALQNGVVQGACQVPDSSLTIPAHVKYRIVLNSKQGTLYYRAVEITSNGSTWSLDNYVPTNPPTGFSANDLTVAQLHFLDGSSLITGFPGAILSGINIDTPDVSISGRYSFRVLKDINLRDVVCSVGSGGTVTINLQWRTDPNFAGVTILNSDMVCDSNSPPQISTNFASNVITAGSYLTVMVSSTTGTPDVVRVFPSF